MKSIVAFASALILPVVATAAPILVGDFNSPNSGDSTEYNWVASLAGHGANPDLGEECETNGFEGLLDEHSLTWTPPAGHDYYYILTKWGLPGGPKSPYSDTYLHLVWAGDTLVFDPEHANGLSHVKVWCGPNTNVPDTTSTLALLGLGLGALGFVARRRKA